MTIREFVDRTDPPETRLTTVNRTAHDRVQAMLRSLFDRGPVTVDERTAPEAPDDRVELRVDGRLAASSPLSAVRDALLLVNSDAYVTGARPLSAVDTPDAVAGLADVPFEVSGYPDSDGKLLLIEMSRHVEARALRAGRGTLHAGFQRLARLAGEDGTRQAYRRLGASDVETHVYGGAGPGSGSESAGGSPSSAESEAVEGDEQRATDAGSGPATAPDRVPDLPDGLSAHVADDPELRRSWFVVHRNGDRSAALVATERDPGSDRWVGLWTYDPDRVRAVAEYVAGRYAGAGPGGRSPVEPPI